MKKVIFVGSTSYSGSTFFDMTLANDPAGFSCGEVYAFFNPFRPHHINPQCGCGDEECRIWQIVKENGEDQIYQTIFKLKPEVNFIVDSSKDPYWIQQQTQTLTKQGIQTKNILIWKTPHELAQSFKKRGIYDEWERTWVVYHRLYYSLVGKWRSVKYEEYVNNPNTLEEICRYLDIPYFEGKEKYWEKRHHLLFGNSSARIHLDKQPIAITEEITKRESTEYQQIYYRPVDDPDLMREIDRRMVDSPLISRILRLLNSYDIGAKAGNNYQDPDIRMSDFDVRARKIKQSIGYAYGRFRYG